MLKLFILLSVTGFHLAECPKEINSRSTFQRNAWLYEAYLDDRFPLYELGRMHLLCLREMINNRLGDNNAAYKDAVAIYELIQGKDFLMDEFTERYLMEY